MNCKEDKMKAMEMIFKDIDYSLEERLDNLMSELTLEEKVSLLSTTQSGIPRLGIKEYQIGGEAAHGVVDREGGKTTVFPQPIGLSNTWNRKLLEEIGSAIGDEARVFYEQNDRKTGLTLWAPTIDMVRDPRWGRTEEAYGEDPYLTGELSSELIKGMQGDHPFYVKLVAAPKHFYGNNNEYGRERISNSIDPRNRYEYYLKAFEPAFKEANALSIMTAYNGINGIPAMQIHEIKDIVKNEWQMDGYVVCDGGALSLNVEEYKYYDTYAEALADALKKGIDCFVDEKELVEKSAYEALEKQYIDEQDITNAIRNILKVRFRLGHFDENHEKDPYYYTDHQKMCSEEHAQLALEATKESVVLLKNEENMLPLNENEINKIAVVGPTADVVYKDWYTGFSPYQITPLDGIKERLKGKEVLFSNGNDHIAIQSLEDGTFLSVSKNDQVSLGSDTITENEIFERENWGWNSNFLKSKSNQKYLRQNEETNIYETKKEEVFDWFIREKLSFYTVDEMRQIYHMSTWQGEPVAVTENKKLTSSKNSAKFKLSVIDSGIKRAVEAAEKSDVAIVCVGNHPMVNGRETEDRADIVLPDHQQKIIEEVYKVNKKVIVVVIGSYPFAINWVDQNIPAVLYSSHGSQMLGKGLAAILFGDDSPSGKLSMTWYKDVNALPSIFDYDIIKGNRTYMYFEDDVLYPFGHGLSYADFTYHSLKLSNSYIDEENPLTVDVKIENESKWHAKKVIQLYASVKKSSVKRPLKQLVDFKKVNFKPYETKTISLVVDPNQLRIWNVNNEKYVLEDSICNLFIGSSSRDIQLQETVQIKGEKIGLRTLDQLTDAENYNDYENIYLDKGEDQRNCVTNRTNGWIGFHEVRFTHFSKQLALRATTDGVPGRITVKLDDLDAEPVSEQQITVDFPWEWKDVYLPLEATNEVHDIYILLEGPVSINTLQLLKNDQI